MLVDGTGPAWKEGQGQGYGGGGEGAYTAPPQQDNRGLPGVLIMELV